MIERIISSPVTLCILLIAVAVAALISVGCNYVIRQREEKELETLRKTDARTKIVLPELEAAIDLMYKGRIKDARTKLCRLRNTLTN